MKKLVKATLFLFATVMAIPTMAANATNIKLLPLSTGSQPVTISMTDRHAHLPDFSNSDRTVTGVWVDDPAEFAQSFKVEAVNGDPKMLAFAGVKGGSSKFTANLITVDVSGNQYIQPINLVKRVSEQNITRFVDRSTEAAFVPSNDRIDSSNVTPTTVTPLSSPIATPSTTVTPSPIATPSTEIQNPDRANAPLDRLAAIDLQQGSIAAGSMSALVDPELKSRVAELVTAANSGQDPYQAAQSIGISQQYVTKLIELGKTNRASQSITDAPQ
jgi:hypothetical protein